MYRLRTSTARTIPRGATRTLVYLLAAWVALAIVPVASAADAGDGQLVQIAIPEGFEGPSVLDIDAHSRTLGYLRPIPGLERGTLIQVTTLHGGPDLEGLADAERGHAADYFVRDVLTGIERARTSFEAGEPTRVSIGGLPAARIEWTGMVGDFRMSGVIYCVLVGPTLVSFHTQGFSDSPPQDRADAIRAIESASFLLPGG
jgi:hypothetical protein